MILVKFYILFYSFLPFVNAILFFCYFLPKVKAGVGKCPCYLR